MTEYTFPIAFEPLKNNGDIQILLDMGTLTTPCKAALTGYIATLGLPTAETQHLSWANAGVGVYVEQLLMNYYLPSLGAQTPAPATKRSATLADKVSEISALNGRYPKCKFLLYIRPSATASWVWVGAEVIQNYGDRVNFLNLLTPYLSQGNLDIVGKDSQIGIKFISESLTNTTLPQSQDFLSIKGAVRVELSLIDSKKNDVTEQLKARIAALELALEGRLINVPANTLLGRNTGVGTVEQIPVSKFATPAMIDQAIIDLVGGAPGALNTLIELAASLNNDANFAATITNSMATKAPLANSLQLTSRSSMAGVPFDANTWNNSFFAGIKWIDGGQINLNVPLNTGMIFQFDSLFGTSSAAKYRVQHYYSGSKYFVRIENNTAWGAWREITTTVV